MEKLCDDCIKLLEWWANNSSLSYAEINVWLFIILQPSLILIYFLFTLVGIGTNSKKVKTMIVWASIIIMLCCALGTYILFAPAIMPVLTEMAYGY